MNNNPVDKIEVSILCATCNRAEILRQTLTAMTNVDMVGITTEIIVIDNNSTDNTKDVIESFMHSLPLRYLFAPKPGKNRALNHALNTVELGEIVVFCDDDIVPSRSWLNAIVRSCKQWTDYSVFGGKIYLVWPETPVPEWAKCSKIHGWAFTRHDDVADQDSLYPAGGHPAGPNFWVRKSVFHDGRRFDESIGPKAGGSFFMGSETSFLFQLARDGYPAIHIPKAEVGHRVQPELLTPESIKKRARRYGGGFYHLRHLPRRPLLQKHPLLWRLVQMLVLTKWAIYYVLASITLSPDRRLLKKLTAIRWLAATKESLNVAARLCFDARIDARNDKTAYPDIMVQFVPYWGGNPYQNQLSEHLAGNGIQMNKPDSLKAVFNRYFLKGQRFNILHIHWLPAVVKPQVVSFVRVVIFMLRLGILRLCGVKIVWTVHNIRSHEGKIQWLDQWLRRTLAGTADALITHSQAAKKKIVSLWNLKSPETAAVVPHGNYIEYYQKTVNQIQARKKLYIPDDKFVILFLGGVRPYKGLPELIESFKACRHENACLLIAGKAVNESFSNQIKDLIAGDNRIRWDSGYIEDNRIQFYMAACDVAAFPYRQVFSSGAVILAMSFGRPCIVPASPTMQDILDASGAFFYDSQSTGGLQNALTEAMQKHDLLAQMGQHNLQQARQWDWDSVAQQTIEVYQRCLTGKNEAVSTITSVHNQQFAEG